MAYFKNNGSTIHMFGSEKMRKKWFVLFATLLLLLAGCGENNDTTDAEKVDESKTEEKKQKNTSETDAVKDFPQLSNEVGDNEQVIKMVTSLGEITIKLFPDIAPKTVENFITHSKEGYYDGVIFHRVMEEFMVQGGDPEGTGLGGESIYGEFFEDEFSNQLFNIRGALSMANKGADTNGSQFFIVQNTTLGDGLEQQMKDNEYPADIIETYVENGGTPWLDGRHTVFGQVIDGMDIVDEIAQVEVNENHKPVEDVIIEKIQVIE